MNRSRHLLVVLALTALFLWFASRQARVERAPEVRAPRLVLQITVDQLRADLLTRHAAQLGTGGFRHLLEEGMVFGHAQHGHANTETIVGHTTLATGADPSVHGMVGNVWLDRGTGRLTYNVEDPEYPLLTGDAGVDARTEIDPTQRLARSDGRSPRRIRVTTFGDQLALRHAGRAKVFGVSVKDRGAIAMAGHAGKAWWFSKQAAAFVTSRFYYDAVPAWVAAWNAERRPARYAGTEWTLARDAGAYLFGDADDRPFEMDLAGFGRTFPHPYGKADDKYFTTKLTVSPAGDELVRAFAEALIDHEQLGADDVPDYLSVSFSSTDYVGHLFGPSSLEAEANLLALDRQLAALLAFVDARVGLQRTLIVLSADHGAPDAPGHQRAFGFEADYIVPERLEQAAAIAALKAELGVEGKLLSAAFPPYLYLDKEAVRAQELDPVLVERRLAEVLSHVDGIAAAISSRDLAAGAVADTPLMRRVLRNHDPRRSGDIYLVFEPGSFINDFDGLAVAAHHGSPWAYDRHVPLMIAGPAIPAGYSARPVETKDIACTLALLLGTGLPSGSSGVPLQEVFPSDDR